MLDGADGSAGRGDPREDLVAQRLSRTGAVEAEDRTRQGGNPFFVTSPAATLEGRVVVPASPGKERAQRLLVQGAARPTDALADLDASQPFGRVQGQEHHRAALRDPRASSPTGPRPRAARTPNPSAPAAPPQVACGHTADRSAARSSRRRRREAPPKRRPRRARESWSRSRSHLSRGASNVAPGESCQRQLIAPTPPPRQAPSHR